MGNTLRHVHFIDRSVTASATSNVYHISKMAYLIDPKSTGEIPNTSLCRPVADIRGMQSV